MEVTAKCGKVSAEDGESVSGGGGTTTNGGGAAASGGGGGTLLQMHKPLAHLLAHRQWWKVCWVYGDQQKYYRQLYGRKKNLTTLRSGQSDIKEPHASSSAASAINGDEDDEDSSDLCNHTLE